MSNLILGKDVLTDWKTYPLNIDGVISEGWPHSDSQRFPPQHKEPSGGPGFFTGTLQPNGLAWDTFLHLRGWTKVAINKKWIYLIETSVLKLPLSYQGQVWINGINLGRYWPARGPQQTLYVPGPLLSTTKPNNITVLELEGAPAHLHLLFIDRPLLSGAGSKS